MADFYLPPRAGAQLTDGKELTCGQVFYVAVAGELDREVPGAGIVALHIPLERAVPGELRSWSCARAGAAFEEGSERGGGGGRVRRRSGMGRLDSLYVGGCGANKPPLAQGVQREGPSARRRTARRLQESGGRNEFPNSEVTTCLRTALRCSITAMPTKKKKAAKHDTKVVKLRTDMPRDLLLDAMSACQVAARRSPDEWNTTAFADAIAAGVTAKVRFGLHTWRTHTRTHSARYPLHVSRHTWSLLLPPLSFSDPVSFFFVHLILLHMIDTSHPRAPEQYG